MSQLISRKSFFQQGLAVAVTALMMTSANAASDAEVKQLREEVQAAKSIGSTATTNSTAATSHFSRCKSTANNHFAIGGFKI